MQNSQFFDKFPLELLANLSEKDFVQKFSFAWILQVTKVRGFQFYLIKCPFSKSQTLKPCKIKFSWNFWTKTLLEAFLIILSRNLSKNHDFSNLSTFFRVLKNQCFIAKISKRADTFLWECTFSLIKIAPGAYTILYSHDPPVSTPPSLTSCLEVIFTSFLHNWKPIICM